MIFYTIKGSDVCHLSDAGSRMLCGLSRFDHRFTLFGFVGCKPPPKLLAASDKRLCKGCKRAFDSLLRLKREARDGR